MASAFGSPGKRYLHFPLWAQFLLCSEKILFRKSISHNTMRTFFCLSLFFDGYFCFPFCFCLYFVHFFFLLLICLVLTQYKVKQKQEQNTRNTWNSHNTRRKRNRRVIWSNPPYSQNVKKNFRTLFIKFETKPLPLNQSRS